MTNCKVGNEIPNEGIERNLPHMQERAQNRRPRIENSFP